MCRTTDPGRAARLEIELEVDRYVLAKIEPGLGLELFDELAEVPISIDGAATRRLCRFLVAAGYGPTRGDRDA